MKLNEVFNVQNCPICKKEPFVGACEDAIKASPRNCDKFHTADEAMSAYAASLGDGKPEWGSFAHWAFDQAEGVEK